MEVLESLARAVVTGIRSGAYVPRMVCGWKACGDCDYRGLCFTDPGVMAVFNPPMAAQVEAARLFRIRIRKFFARTGIPPETLRELCAVLVDAPGQTTEGLGWLLDNWQEEEL